MKYIYSVYAHLRNTFQHRLRSISLHIRCSNESICNGSNTRQRTLKGFQSPSAFWKSEPKVSLFNARGLRNPGKVRRRIFQLTSQTYTIPGCAALSGPLGHMWPAKQFFVTLKLFMKWRLNLTYLKELLKR